jgi:hypothetical protein
VCPHGVRSDSRNDVTEQNTDLLDEHEAAVVLSKPAGTLRQWRSRGLGPPYVKLGMSIRYRRADLERFIVDNTIEPGAHKAAS